MEKSSAKHPSGPSLLSALEDSRGGEAERIDGQLKALISKELSRLLGVLVRCAHQMFPAVAGEQRSRESVLCSKSKFIVFFIPFDISVEMLLVYVGQQQSVMKPSCLSWLH